jgi:hypothetical protein
MVVKDCFASMAINGNSSRQIFERTLVLGRNSRRLLDCKLDRTDDESHLHTQTCLSQTVDPSLCGEVSSGASYASEDTVKPAPEKAVQRFENYEVVTGEDGKLVELGRGAMGVTYKAFDVDLHYPRTLKVISERYLGDELAQLRFLREARASVSVRHPNVASVSIWAEPVKTTFTRWSL